MTRAEAGRALLLALAVGACSRDGGSPSSAPHAKRIVSLGPATTEALYAIGAGDRLVARSQYCDYPPEATRLPAVGGIEPDVEAILELGPDLVVGPSGQWSARLTATLGAHGIATWFPQEIQTLTDVDALIVGLGQRTDHAERARAVTAALDAREQAIEDAAVHAPPLARASGPGGKPRVLVVAGLGPVVVAGPRSFADDLLRHAGAVNAVTEGGAWPSLGLERVAELDPDVVIDITVAETGGATQITAQAPGWGGVTAVREGRVVPLGDERVLRPGPRIAEGLEVLAHALHPGAAIP